MHCFGYASRSLGSLPSFWRGLQPLNPEIITPALEPRAWNAVEFQVVERLGERHRVEQRRELAVEEGVVAMIDQRGRELERAARLDLPLRGVRGNLLEPFIDAEQHRRRLLAEARQPRKAVGAVARSEA